jgi:hypothetical protein
MDRRSFIWASALAVIFTFGLALSGAADEAATPEAGQPSTTVSPAASAPAEQPAPAAPESGQKPAKEAKPERQFQAAQESFLKKDYATAGAEIRKAARFLRKKAQEVTGEGRQALNASVKELKRLAADVEKGAVKSVDRLDETFERARQALAEHHTQS